MNIEDIFTKDGEKVDLEVNKLTTECIASKNNKFLLDNEGNLSINSLTTIKPIIDILYPVGSIYMSIKDTNPSNFFGGTWERIKGRCLFGVDEDQTEFNTPNKIGGSKYLQRHRHNKITSLWGGDLKTYTSDNGSESLYDLGNANVYKTDRQNGALFVTDYEGTGNAGNLPPYITCYIWKRTI